MLVRYYNNGNFLSVSIHTFCSMEFSTFFMQIFTSYFCGNNSDFWSMLTISNNVIWTNFLSEDMMEIIYRFQSVSVFSFFVDILILLCLRGYHAI